MRGLGRSKKNFVALRVSIYKGVDLGSDFTERNRRLAYRKKSMNYKMLFRNLMLCISLSGLFCCSLMVSSCAVNPATKERQFMIVSEDQEFAMGQEVDKQVREEMGVYLELPELRSLVKNVGETLGRNSDRPKIIYRIEIVDSADFNA